MNRSCFIPFGAPLAFLRSTSWQRISRLSSSNAAGQILRTCITSLSSVNSTPELSRQPRHIILLSGGVESSTLLHVAASKGGHEITGLFCDYGQRAAHHELRACEAQCKHAHVTDLLQVDLTSVTSAFQKRSTERRHVPLHHRNGVLLSLGLSLAGQEGASRISVAICKDDASWYLSASPDFLRAFREVGQTLGGVAIESPLEQLTKREVIQLGEAAGVRWESTWSCMIGRGDGHCGRCVQCRARKRAFEEAGVAEVDGFYMR